MEETTMQHNSQYLQIKPDQPLFKHSAQLLDGLFSWYAEMRHEFPVFAALDHSLSSQSI